MLLGVREGTDIATDTGLTAGVALADQDLVDTPTGRALLPWLVLALGEHGGDAVVEGTELRSGTGRGLGIDRRGRRPNGSAHALTGYPEFTGDLANALALVVVGVTNGRVLVHREHLHLCFHGCE